MEKSMFIIGGGPSLEGFNFCRLENRDTIAVNKSIFDIPNPNYFITVDFIFLRRIKKRMELFQSINTTKIFVVDFHFPYIEERNGRIVDARNSITYDLSAFDVIIKSRKEEGIGYTFKEFRTGLNTGYCAMQLAIILGYEKIYLLGIDLNQTKETHYHGGYGERPDVFKARLPIYFKHFEKALKQIKKDGKNIKVISLSPVSKLNDLIPYQDIEKVLCTTT